MMKKLVVLTAVVMLTAGSIGCQQCSWFRRGALFPSSTPEVTVCDPCPPPCDPCCDPCNTCDPCAPGSFTTTAPPTILPGPGLGTPLQ